MILKNIHAKLKRRCLDPVQYWYVSHLRSRTRFKYNQEKYQYCANRYNFSWANERSVEIPIFQKILGGQHPQAHILEVGNVMSHYQPIEHTVLDKYEKSSGVINQDILDFRSAKKYDLIFSISTLEHVGWDEDTKDPTKIEKSLLNLKSILKRKGEIWFSVPLGYNPNLDKQITLQKLPLTEKFFLKRASNFTNVWIEIDESKIRKPRYGKPYPHANIVMIGKYCA